MKFSSEYSVVIPIFDVAHYRPFRFAAQVQVADENGSNPEITPAADALLSNEVHGDQEEDIDEVSLSYKPGQRVDILLDITSFKGSDDALYIRSENCLAKNSRSISMLRCLKSMRNEYRKIGRLRITTN